jgi:hypothetical protein
MPRFCCVPVCVRRMFRQSYITPRSWAIFMFISIRFSGIEVVVEIALGDRGGLKDVLDTRMVEPLGVNQFSRLLENPLFAAHTTSTGLGVRREALPWLRTNRLVLNLHNTGCTVKKNLRAPAQHPGRGRRCPVAFFRSRSPPSLSLEEDAVETRSLSLPRSLWD